MAAVRCSSSLREVPAAETLAVARRLAPELGVTRVTEVTRLDRIGLPVFVSVRPDAEPGSVCVSAGKGLAPVEAEVGAMMEAIELAWAEHRRCRETVPVETARVGELDPPGRRFAVLEHCPIWGTPIDLDAEIACVTARDLATDRPVRVPAEAVIHPLPAALGGVRLFGTSSNGLASGNSVREATAHALAEVIERDVVSFHVLLDRPRPVAPASLPAPARAIAERLDAVGFGLTVQALPNAYGLPAFTATVFDRRSPDLASPGDGLHPSREIALVRAITESAQARLSFIHGGRDDLGDPAANVAAAARRAAARAADEPALDFREVPDLPCADVEELLRALAAAVERAVGAPILRVVYTPPDYPVQVVRVIVPGLEIYSRETARIGPRLLAAIRQSQT